MIVEQSLKKLRLILPDNARTLFQGDFRFPGIGQRLDHDNSETPRLAYRKTLPIPTLLWDTS